MDRRPREAIKAVLFDMDGVLSDATDWHYEALNDALALFGMAIPREQHLAVYDGLPTRHKLKTLTLTRGLPARLHDFINELKQRRTLELAFTHCRPKFIHQFALSRLKAERYRLAVCSNSIRQTVDAMLGRAALDQYIEFSLSNEDVTRAKPNPEIYSAAIARMGVAPDACVVVEDNPNGIEAARASGAHCLEVASVNDVTYERITRFISALEGRAR
jgi:beta-phosphoglucomutase-like phosphatase (HAD superfamily)